MRGPRKRALTALAAASLLGAAPGAAAQSAGDEQYADPFGQNLPEQQRPAERPAGTGSPPASAPAASSPGTETAQARPGSAQTGQDSARPGLPNTGFPAAVLAAAGLALLAGGAALRRVS